MYKHYTRTRCPRSHAAVTRTGTGGQLSECNSIIQRKLKLACYGSGRIVDQLEAAGILGAFEGSKARRVLIPNEAALAAHLNQGVAAGPGVGGF